MADFRAVVEKHMMSLELFFMPEIKCSKDTEANLKVLPCVKSEIIYTSNKKNEVVALYYSFIRYYYHVENWIRVHRISLYYFLQLQMNLQLSQI